MDEILRRKNTDLSIVVIAYIYIYISYPSIYREYTGADTQSALASKLLCRASTGGRGGQRNVVGARASNGDSTIVVEQLV